MSTDNGILETVETFQHLLVSHATGGNESDKEYKRLRAEILSDGNIAKKVPRFVRTCRSIFQFWEYIKHQFFTYHERRTYLWDEFRPLFEFLENRSANPSDPVVSEILEEFNHDKVHEVWSKALERRDDDPEGAITLARTLLETICKHILDEMEITYKDDIDLPKLYRLTGEQLNLVPDQHLEKVFKQILGGCTSVVEGLGSLRNKLSDAHGRGKGILKPAPRHAELAVNLAGSMAMFLVETWSMRKKAEKSKKNI